MDTRKIGNLENRDAMFEFYFKHEKQIMEESLEGYKWSILDKVHATLEDYWGRHYKEGKWDDNYQDFPDLVKTSAYDGGNLLYSNAKSVIRYVADFYPRELREMFINLYNESINIDDRINTFIDKLETISKKDSRISKTGRSFHTDKRSVAYYLFMKYPEKYYLFKQDVFFDFAGFIQLEQTPKSSSPKLYSEYLKVCEFLRERMQKLYPEKIEQYLEQQKEFGFDSQAHLLVQNIMFCYQYYKDPSDWALIEGDPFVKLQGKAVPISFALNGGSKKDYIAEAIKAKKLGDYGEGFVLEEEKRRIQKEYGKTEAEAEVIVKHISKTAGDGTGYDIQSVDETEKPIFIEVKSTKGSCETDFFITATELEASRFYGDQYRLYRVFELHQVGLEIKGKIAVWKGPLDRLCISPANYIVRLRNET